MKRFLFICLSICISFYAHAQATDLVIDNQTPGWLSSKINYDDQQTVRNLKVSGYINSADLYFIGTLIQKQSLNGRIDLADCYIVNTDPNVEDNYLNKNSFGIQKYTAWASLDSISYLILPHKLNDASWLLGDGSNENSKAALYVDTLECNWANKSVKKSNFGVYIKNLILGANIDSIPDNAFESKILENVTFTNSIRYIGSSSFPNIKSCNFNELTNLTHLGQNAFRPYASSNDLVGFCPDTIKVPKSLQDPFYLFTIGHKDGQHIFIENNISTISGYSVFWGKPGNTFSKLIFHINNSNPPEIVNYSGLNNDNNLSSSFVYVPKGAKQAYLKANWWKNATIIEVNPVETVTLNEHQITLNKEEQFPLSVSVTPEDADDKNIEWKSEDETIAKVDAHGVVTAIKEGETKIYATSTATGIQDVCMVLVRKNVTSVSLEESQIFLSQIGESKQLVAVITPDDATDKSVIWKSSNEQVCTVSEAGLVTATGVGTAVVTVTTVDGGHTATCTVKVIQHVTDIALNKNNVSLKVGESDLLKVTVNPANADNKSVVWSSSNEQIATVDANGNVKAMKAGEAWIKAVSEDNAQAKDSCKVTVIQPVTGVTLSQTSYRLTNIGENIQLEATVEPEDASNKEVKWSSSDESVCIVANGKVVATGFGTAVVMAITADGGFMATCAIVVEKETIPVTDVTLSQTQALLIEGERLQLTATVKPNDATNKNLIWKSSDETVCVVTQSGLLIAMMEGEAVVTVIPENGVGQAQCSVTVISKENAAIEDVIGDSSSSVPVYDMMGCKVTHLVKGRLYIRNGQKFIAQ